MCSDSISQHAFSSLCTSRSAICFSSFSCMLTWHWRSLRPSKHWEYSLQLCNLSVRFVVFTLFFTTFSQQSASLHLQLVHVPLRALALSNSHSSSLWISASNTSCSFSAVSFWHGTPILRLCMSHTLTHTDSHWPLDSYPHTGTQVQSHINLHTCACRTSPALIHILT